MRIGAEGLAQARSHLPLGGTEPFMARFSRLASTLFVLTVCGAGTAAAQETATWYIPTYTHDIVVCDEASEEIVDRIEVEHHSPNEVVLNEARDRLYVQDATLQDVEIVDLHTRRVVDSFTLNSGNSWVRIDGLT